MKMLHLMSLLAVTAAWAGAAEPGLKPEDRMQAQAVRNSPIASVANPALLLPPLLVTGSPREANRPPEPVLVRDLPFTLMDGGYFWRHTHPRVVVELKLQYHPGRPGYDLVGFSW